MKDSNKEFGPTSWAIDNRVAIYVAVVFICLAGMITYNKLPKENFPEVVLPQIFVTSIFPGASPKD
ncbi:MAG: efflux RND transporter permease subunit, partial [Flammeovirgaceae bacterium]|nr:efflux RND transporter permease subunit [Flammeovirgaceae bacterium]